MSLAPAYAQALEAGTFGALEQAYLHRATAEDALALHVGRDVLIAQAVAHAALVRDARVDIVHDGSMLGVTRLRGIHDSTIWNVPPLDAQVSLREHRWSRREGSGVIEDVVVTDWAGLAEAINADLGEVAAEIGAASPLQLPLGELRSGRGQLAPSPSSGWGGACDELVDAIHRIWNGRRLDEIQNLFSADATWVGPRGRSGGPAELRRWLTKLLAALPDATLVPDEVEASGEHVAIRWRLFGHRSGRRVRMIVSMLLRIECGKIVADDTLLDELALLATPYRPLMTL